MKFETTVHMAVGDHVFINMALDQGAAFHGLAQIVRLEDALTDRLISDDQDVAVLHDGRRLIRAAVKWEAVCPSDRARLQQFLVHIEDAGAG
jgi:hypothetical protein